MRTLNRYVMTAAAITAMGGGAAHADVQFAIGGALGTPGGTVEAQVSLNDFLGFRGGYNYLAFDVDEDYDGVDYSGELDMTTFGAFVDLHPFQNSFLVTGGAYIGDKTLEGVATPTEPVEIGDLTFTPDQVGTLDMSADIGDMAPFFGIGFDTTFQGDGNWGFKAIVGAMITDSPSVDLTSTGSNLTGDALAVFEAELEQERQNLEDDIEDFKTYPVLQVGLTYRF